MTKEDLRVQRTKKILKETLKNMLINLSYEKITVKDLCEKSMINRRTFYLHYDSIDNLLEDIQLDYTIEFYKIIKDYDFYYDIDKLTYEYFSFSEKNGLIFEKINTNPNFEYIRQQMVQKVKMYVQDSNNFKHFDKFDNYKKNIIISFINDSTVSCYRSWIKDGRKISMEEAIELTTLLIKNGIKEL